MDMAIEFEFFIYLLAEYACYKNTPIKDVLNLWNELDLTPFIMEMYEMYHRSALENAFEDIDAQTEQRMKI